jgi:BASS family bile acid:Na+ symporter
MDNAAQADFQFDPKFGILLGILIAVMVFGVALDLRWAHFQRVAKNPRAILAGMVSQFFVLPGIAFLVGKYMVEDPSITLGLFMVAACPGGSVSNYVCKIARGDVATSISMSSITMVVSLVTTPLVFGLLTANNPHTAALMQEVGIHPGQLAGMFMVTVGFPVIAGMVLNAKKPKTAEKLRKPIARLSAVLFLVVFFMGFLTNFGLIKDFSKEGLVPVLICCGGAMVIGWALAWLVRAPDVDRRAVTIEAAGQNIGLGIGISVAFFPKLVGVAVMGALYGVIQAVMLIGIALVWH